MLRFDRKGYFSGRRARLRYHELAAEPGPRGPDAARRVSPSWRHLLTGSVPVGWQAPTWVNPRPSGVPRAVAMVGRLVTRHLDDGSNHHVDRATIASRLRRRGASQAGS
ncbi:hypothetical protein ACFQ60_04510 [Streptomyces zhihengii]